MAKTYIATIRHHSISRGREVEIVGTLAQAKAEAWRQFGDEQRDYEIAIYRAGLDQWPVCTRRVSGGGWERTL